MIEICKGYFRLLKTKVAQSFLTKQNGLEKEEDVNQTYFIRHVNHLFYMDNKDEIKIDRDKKIAYCYSMCLNEIVGLSTEEEVMKNWEMIGIKIISFEEYIKKQMKMYGWKRIRKPKYTPIDKGLWYKEIIDANYEVTVVIDLNAELRFRGVTFININLINKEYKIPSYEISNIYDLLKICEKNLISCGIPFALHYNFTGQGKKLRKQENTSLRGRTIS